MEGAEGGWRLECATENAGRCAGAQRIGVVDAVTARKRGGDQRHHLVARVRPARGIAEVEVGVNEFGQAEMLGERGRQNQPGIGHEAEVVEGDTDTVGMVAC